MPQALIQRRSQRSAVAPLPTWEEQGLCIGATFFVRTCLGNNIIAGEQADLEGVSSRCRLPTLLQSPAAGVKNAHPPC